MTSIIHLVLTRAECMGDDSERVKLFKTTLAKSLVIYLT
jgi:hypothetical protein